MMPRLGGHASLDGSIIGAEAPSRTSCSSGSVLNSVCAPPSVWAVPVTRAMASPTRYFARYSAARVAGVRPCVPLSQAASTSYHVASGGSYPTLSLSGAIPEVLSLMTSLGMSGLRSAEVISGPWALLFRGVRVQSRLYRLMLTLLLQEGDGLLMQATAFVPEQEEEESRSDLPSILGLYGCLERVRFAVAPAWRPSLSVLPEPRYMPAGLPDGPMADRPCALSSYGFLGHSLPMSATMCARMSI
jgi:hypothetical protein